jgi:hypothetical protein
MSNLRAKRENFPKLWEDAGLSRVGITMLELQMKQHVLIIGNIDKDSQANRANLQLQAREQVLQRMQEQIKIRDNLLQNAKRHFNENAVDIDLDDPKLVDIEEIIKINSSLPPINNNPYSGSNNYNGGNKSKLGALKSKYKSRLGGNSSLPPIPRIRENGNGNYYKNSKNQYQKNMPYSNAYGAESNRAKQVGKIGISFGNRNSQNNNVNSFHSQMRKNKHTFSTPSLRAKKRYSYKIKTANVRDSSNSKIASNKPYYMPKTGQRGMINRNDRRLQSPEERKIDNSVRSNDQSIVSTASSNSNEEMKYKNDSGLQIAGQQLSLKKGRNRFNRSPVSRKPQNNLRNYANNNFSVDNRDRVNKYDKKQVLANLNKQYRNKHL